MESSFPFLILVTLIVAQWVRGEDISRCCSKLLIKSSGEARLHQDNRLGEFLLRGVYNERPMYQHRERGEYLFYLVSRNKGLWMIGPEVGQFNGGLANRADESCANEYTKFLQLKIHRRIFMAY